MTYVHIPAKFAAREHARLGVRLLHRLRYGTDRAIAERNLTKIWQPDGVWREFVNQQLASLGQQPL